MKTIIINNRTYDLSRLINIFNTENIEIIKQLVIEREEKQLEDRRNSYIKFSDEIDAHYRLANAIGASINTDLYKFAGN